MEIRSIVAPAPGPQGLDALGATAAPAPVQTVSNVLDPPVRIDIGPDAGEGRFVRDGETKSLVFQVVDPRSGDVIVQLPTETVLRNRAYDASARAHTAEASRVMRVA